MFGIIDSYYRAGATEKARALTDEFVAFLEDELNYYQGLSRSDRKRMRNDWSTDLQFYQMLIRTSQADQQYRQSLTQGYNAVAAKFQ